jgi:phosphoribosylamine--glycine ligase
LKVLIFGSGGREHALAWAVKRSPRVTELVCAPGNGGMASIVRLVPADLRNVDSMLNVVANESPDLVIIGPELPLSLGIVDLLTARGIRVFGPTRNAAMLETSKAFAKRFMQRNNIPTAAYSVCSPNDDLEKTISRFHPPIVVKADGLAAGKGVLICDSRQTALEAAHELFAGKHIESPAEQVVIEEFLIGEEVSFLCIADGKTVLPLAPAQDHKRIGEGDKGPNTGGMGVYSTDSLLEPGMSDWILHHIAQPTIDAMATDGNPFSGVLYIGLMMTARGPMVLEYNTRFGDPETQAILVRLESDLVDALEAAIDGRLNEVTLSWKPGASASVIASSDGYPGSYKTGLPITGLDKIAAEHPDVQVFHSGTKMENDHLLTAGGRVLGVTAAAPSLKEALDQVYSALDQIHFEGVYFRRDIGHRVLK